MVADLRPVYIGDAPLLQLRDSNSKTCVSCDDRDKLTCPICLTNQQCQFTYPTNCSVCPYASCVDKEFISSPVTSPNATSNPGVGPLAGGVVGGVAVIAAITYLIWRYCIKARRGTVEAETWVEKQAQSEKGEEDGTGQRSSPHPHPASIRTRHSIASTVLTRASNIIQIAYIPGVTNRARPSSPLVPPVPPIPICAPRDGSPLAPEDKRFFVPGDLRDSTLSTVSDYTGRTDELLRISSAARSSVASTIYPKKAVIVSGGQAGMRAKPAVVSVPGPHSPANSTLSVGSTFLSSARAASPARAMMVRVGNVCHKSKASSSSDMAGRVSRAATLIEESPDFGPFADPPETPAPKPATSLVAVIEEATLRASAKTSKAKAIPFPIIARCKTKSPSGDEHATKRSVNNDHVFSH